MSVIYDLVTVGRVFERTREYPVEVRSLFFTQQRLI